MGDSRAFGSSAFFVWMECGLAVILGLKSEESKKRMLRFAQPDKGRNCRLTILLNCVLSTLNS